MRIFVTGATGFIGSAIVQELIGARHEVIGLARSDAAARSLAAAGARVHRGALEDLASLERGAAESDGVIHTAFIHDFSKFEASCETDQRAINALGAALAGSGRPLVVSSGSMGLANEEAAPNASIPRKSEQTALATAAAGVRAMVIRLSPSVHGDGDHGFVPRIIAVAREKGFSSYVGDGKNRWPAVHRLDAARLYRLAIEKGTSGARFHAVADEGVPIRDIAEIIGRRLNVPVVSKSPEEAVHLFGFVGRFLAMDGPSSSRRTQEQLGWRPSERGLIADLEQGRYFD
ncbi:MAG TPA: SDR family oxidoreductase [Polyangia bacterium]|nr:SDR family oxidoreductase [Polyangia bacterium]